jgi:hypothetical protein
VAAGDEGDQGELNDLGFSFQGHFDNTTERRDRR